MTKELLAAAFCIGSGLCLAGAATYFYQWLTRQQAMLRMDGETAFISFGHVIMSFVCGPYIMLQLGWQQEEGGVMSMTSVLFAAFIAFGWAFITGLLFLNAFLALPI